MSQCEVIEIIRNLQRYAANQCGGNVIIKNQ